MLFIKKYKTPYHVCDKVVNYFEENRSLWTIGRCGARNGVEVNKDVKDSIDLCLKQKPKELNEYFDCLGKYINKYIEEFDILKNTTNLVISEGANIQKYKKNGGFKKWHMERGEGNFGIKRALVFMTYLNDAKHSGTDFKYQKISFECIKGDTLIWPADFTHTHRGQVTQETKYIITGWVHYEK
jgi:hypothetical protein